MSSQTKWKEEQVLVICPGSSTTMAQLGCSELTPPSQRFPTRMFKDEQTGAWRPYHTVKRKKENLLNTNGGAQAGPVDGAKAEEEYEFVEDPDSSEGAVYPIRGGRIVHMEAFLAFLDHVHSMLTTTYHNTPITLMASPQWTRPDCEAIARYVFEKTKTPALCLIHSGVATQYGLRWPTMTVVDIGFQKVDVTCIYDNRIVNHKDLGLTTPESEKEAAISGGEAFTLKLKKLLEGQGFTYEMAEQLKKSQICEVLPYAADQPGLMELPSASGSSQQSAAAPTGQPAAQAAAGTTSDLSVGAEADDGVTVDDKGPDNDGVLDIANIVTSGQTKEFLAKKEREKQERAKAGKKGKGPDAVDANKPSRLPNSKRLKNVFHYEEIVHEEPAPAPAKAVDQEKEKEKEKEDVAPPANGEGPKVEAQAGEAEKPAGEQPSGDAFKVDNFLPPPDSTSAPATSSEPQTKRIKRDIEIGLERFTFADRAEIDRIATTIYRAVQEIGDMYMRPGCWDNIVFVGNGSRIRGLKDNILQTLTLRHLISPSSATMFTSELPSNVATPAGTGSQTPTGSFTGPPHTMPTGASSGVNPLLQAATTAASLQQTPHPGVSTPGGAPGSTSGEASAPHMSHHFHSQTPTSIKLATMPTYLAEWTKHGFEEAMFLGSLVAARLVFCVHNLDAQGLEAQRSMSLHRVDFNELGPKAIRTHSMLG
ncbi:hypothetical protein KVR01_003661 [Diaporthe batatas]|uniref:uncharacterized protein n=1 Tax=Diaporthe batatas TaxID=748121 RepID=UPI001D05590B|nr:uncharacterized protein KVR01_003661 [Diaporthe batatas]KAG8167972.1 hypothetical protein KVR01_003661 [Diaporthe batatas]